MSRTFTRTTHILVGPPHPISNLRPVLYNGLPDKSKSNNYTPSELRSHVPVDGNKFQLDLTLQRIDKSNHEFWVQSNQRFYTMRDAFLNARKAQLELAKSDEERTRMEDEHIAEFHRLWMDRERAIQREYTSEWLRAQYGALWTAARMTWQSWIKKILPS